MLDTRTRVAKLSDQELVAEMVRHTGARPSDALMLVGGGNANVMADLCRRGFAQVCLVVAPCARGGETADILWLPRASPETLAGKLRGLSRSLSAGGAIVLHGDAISSQELAASLRRLLHAAGFDAVRQVATAAGFCLVGRKPSRHPQRQRAA